MTDPQQDEQPVDGHADELPDDPGAYADPDTFPPADEVG
jgi:hypothetical protein